MSNPYWPPFPDVEFRAQPTVVLDAPEPAIYYGQPVMPTYWARSDTAVTAIQGPTHIHAIANPDTVKSGSGISNPPKLKWNARWTVRDLPDPSGYPNGFYWLGVPSASDGSSSYANVATRQWNPANDSDGGSPAWHSFFPFKPSVVSVDRHLAGGGIVHHPKGVNFNSHFIEHMWLDWGSNRPQPFTWLITAAVASWPHPHYTHYMLDAGRDPDVVGFPRLTEEQVNDGRVINDNLPYRTMMSVAPTEASLCTRFGENSARTVRADTNASLRPRMYVGIFNGSASYSGVYSPGRQQLRRGAVDNGAAYAHRYYVLGRRVNYIAQNLASHLLVFEIRFFRRALTAAQLSDQYNQLSSVWKFNEYRGL